MDLLEYQAKELFRQAGIPVLPSQKIARPSEVNGLTIPYPIVLKSQVDYSGQSKASGVRFAENQTDAIASAEAAFHLPIRGIYPEVLLAEPKYEAAQEFYLAIVLDSSARRPLLLGSQYGGIEVEAGLEQVQQVIVDQEFSSFYARRLALKMGLEGSLIQPVSAIIEKMYHLFIHHDLDLVEINPLAVSDTGELMALDGKVKLNDAAFDRHENLSMLVGAQPQGSSASSVYISRTATTDSSIGVLCNGTGLTMATLDLIAAQGKLAHFIDLGNEFEANSAGQSLLERLTQGLDLLLQDNATKVVLVNILSSSLSCRQVAEIVVTKLRQLPTSGQSAAIVLRTIGNDFYQAQELLLPFGIVVVEQLEAAVAQAIDNATTAAWEFRLQSAYLHQSSSSSSSQSPVPSP
ncbi:acetate--CoA ligase family protein [Phormidium tenue FACHB-886]|nr:acetate--CoA ligase family protein [Phormidium tenue FACHB-886]